jgi:hypothetical protein
MEQDSVAENQDLGLADAIDGVRSELRRAQDAGRDSDVRFAVGEVEVEFAVDATRKAGGEASIKVLSVLSIGGRGERSRGETHRVKVTLSPIGVRGQPFEVASAGHRRPDPRPEQQPNDAEP